jgi:SAM-dependent methyltransferase
MTEPQAVSDTATSDNHYTDWKGWHGARFGHYSRSDARYYSWHLRRCLKNRSGPALPLRVLELGYGNGGFMAWARASGYEIEGVEVQPELLERAQAAGYRVASSMGAMEPSRSFDLIVAFDVLEHVQADALPEFMSNITDRLEPSGRLLIRVPNGDSPFGRPNQHGDLTHVTTFGSDKLRQLAAFYGLEVEAHGETPWRHRQGMSRTPANAVRAALRYLLEAWIRYSYAWAELSMAPNLVSVLKRRSSD